METTDTTVTDSSERERRSRELVRPSEGRMIAGVAKGVADHFGISDWIPRIFFVATAFMGGFGIVLYAAGWAFIRSEEETKSPAERFFTGASGMRSWLGVAFIALAAVLILENFTILSGEVVWAGALLVVGLLLYLGYLPATSQAKPEAGTGSESKEGVQRMTSTDTLVPQSGETAAGDSPAGGASSPPPAPTPTPPALPPRPPRETSILGRLTIGAMLMGMGVLAILDNVDSLPIAAQPRHYLALAVTILGVGLLVGSIAGRARWLIIIGAILVPTLLFSPAFEYDWSNDNFDRFINPVSFGQLDAGYSSDIGQMRIDLTDLDWNGQVVDLSADLDIGQLTIIVPDDVGLFGSAGVNIGAVHTRDRVSAGLGRHDIDLDEPGPNGEVHLDAHVDIGDVEIITR
jgi:phage shock protein PspC (stress-responsive transcriptional regulator)